LELNPLLEDAPEIINQDPYGKRWIVVMELLDWEVDRAALLDASHCLERAVEHARTELKP
jgi:glycine cleavage system H lipoate-binding protein